MKVKLIGKAHIQGVGKESKKPFDFIQLHFIGRARGVFGEAALTANVDPSLIPYDSILVPGDYNLEFDNKGYCVECTHVVK